MHKRIHFISASIFVLLTALPLRADSRLIFPRILLQQGRFAGIAIANPNTATARITMKAYQSDGSLFTGKGVLNPATADIPAGQQYSALAKQIFNPPPEIGEATTPTRLWVEITSTTDGLTGFFLDGNDFLDYLDGSDLGNAGVDLVLPLIENTGSSSTEISLVNPNESAADVTLEFFRANGSTVSTQTAKLAVRGAVLGPLSTLYPILYSEVEGVRIRSDKSVVCFAYILRSSDNTLITLSALNVASAAKTLSFPQMAQGAGWSTSIGLVNASGADSAVTITAYKADGTLFSAPTVRENPVTKTIPAGGVFRSGLKSLFGFADSPLQEGWIKAASSKPALHGYVEYGAGPSRALVSAQLEAHTRAIFSHQALASPFYTGLAVLNTSALAANIEVASVTKDGKILGKAQRALKPGQREAKLIEQWVKAAAGTVGGSVFLKSDTPVVATQLFGTTTYTALANVPPQRITTSFDPTTALPSVKVSPDLAVVETGKTKQFTSSGVSGLSWRVNDIPGGNDTIGTISTAGLFKAPAIASSQHTVTVGAATASGDQSGGASVNVVQRETIISGLSVVTAVAYFENLQRFFVAEQQTLASAPDFADALPAATINAKISEQSATGTLTQFVVIPNDTAGKMLPFTDSKGSNHLLVAGTTSGTIYRIDLATKALAKPVQGLNKPNSMTFDPVTGNLLVCEEDQIRNIPRSNLEPTTSPFNAPAEQRPEATPKWALTVKSPRGIAVDRCSGALYVTLADGSLLEIQGNRERYLPGTLSSPNEILPVYIAGVTTCKDSLALLINDATGIIQVFPFLDKRLTFTSSTQSPQDLVFIPAKSPFAPRGEDSVGVGETGTVSGVRVGGLLTKDEPVTTGGTQSGSTYTYRDPQGDTFETSASTQQGYSVPDLISVDIIKRVDSVSIALTFTQAVEPGTQGSKNGVVGYIDFDTRPGVGQKSNVEVYTTFGNTGLGVDQTVDLWSGSLWDLSGDRSTPVKVEYQGKVIVVTIPKSVLDLSRALMALIIGNWWEPTDIAPNQGNINLGLIPDPK